VNVLRIANIVGTRPNLVKMAPLLAAQRARPDVFRPLLVHTGQHRGPAMSERFFAELALPTPDITLDAGSRRHADPILAMAEGLERALARLAIDLVLVVGDVNSTAAGALAAARLKIPLAHVEAGLRSFDATMPEEANRVLVDTLSDYLFASESSGVVNLLEEGRAANTVHHVGNVMIDALVRFRGRAGGRNPAAAIGIGREYGVLTLHRPVNVDCPDALVALLATVCEISRRLPIVFPVHPRTRDRLQRSGLASALAANDRLVLIEPLGYLDMLALLERAVVVLTDSGGVQEETTYLGVPCLTLRETTERPATVADGTNRVIGTRHERVLAEVDRVLSGDRPPPRRPQLWDGRAAERVMAVLAEHTGVIASIPMRQSAFGTDIQSPHSDPVVEGDGALWERGTRL